MVYLPLQFFMFISLGREEGQGLLEYALVILLVALVVFLLVTVLGPQIGNMYSNIIYSF